MIEAQTQDEFIIHFPKVLKNYNFIKIIGNGLTCVVALVEDRITHEKYSAKIISKIDAIKKNILEDIDKEIRILKELDHPNIIKINESFEIANDNKEELIVIILEYCEKDNLFEYVINSKKENQKTIKQIISTFPQVIKYLHDKGIAHGDIKPENILLDSNLNLKLCDFGFCHTKIIVDDNKSKRGTLYYAAPELFLKGKFNSLKVDIYAFGILLYVINEKEFPFKDGDIHYIASQKTKGKLCIRKGIEEKLKNLIIKCTELHPYSRPTIDDIINDEYFSEYQETNEKQKDIIKIVESNSAHEFEIEEKMIQIEKGYVDNVEIYEIQMYNHLLKNKHKKMKRNKKHNKIDRSKHTKNKYKYEYEYQEPEITYC